MTTTVAVVLALLYLRSVVGSVGLCCACGLVQVQPASTQHTNRINKRFDTLRIPFPRVVFPGFSYISLSGLAPQTVLEDSSPVSRIRGVRPPHARATAYTARCGCAPGEFELRCVNTPLRIATKQGSLRLWGTAEAFVGSHRSALNLRTAPSPPINVEMGPLGGPHFHFLIGTG